MDDLNKYKIFNYNVASLATTQESEEVTKKYNNIFNLVNTDDIVTKIPWTEIGFRRYGIDVQASIKDDYLDEFKRRTNLDKYYCIGKDWNKNILELGTSREEFYEINENHMCLYLEYETLEDAQKYYNKYNDILEKYKIKKYFIVKDIVFEDGQYIVTFLNCLAALAGLATNFLSGNITIPSSVMELFEIIPLFSNYSTFITTFLASIGTVKIFETIGCPHFTPSCYFLAEHAEVK